MTAHHAVDVQLAGRTGSSFTFAVNVPPRTRTPTPTAATRATIANSLGSGAALNNPHSPLGIVHAAQNAFVSALGTGLLVGAVVTICGAVLAWVLIEPRASKPALAAEPVPDSGQLVEAEAIAAESKAA